MTATVSPATTGPMNFTSKMTNLVCCLLTAAVFGMIIYEAGSQPGPTHTGTQEVR